MHIIHTHIRIACIHDNINFLVYNRFFFIAYIAPFLQPPPGAPPQNLGQCGYNSCMTPLSINLAIIFGTRLLVSNTVDAVVNWLTYKDKIAAETANVDSKGLTMAEADYILLPYNSLLDNITNYADLAVSYGYMVLFVVALPIAPLLSLITSYVKLKYTMWKQLMVRG